MKLIFHFQRENVWWHPNIFKPYEQIWLEYKMKDLVVYMKRVA